MSKTRSIRWEDLRVGDRFVDGSTVIKIHPVERKLGFKFWIKEPGKLFPHSITVSSDHLFLCKVETDDEELLKHLKAELSGMGIVTEYEQGMGRTESGSYKRFEYPSKWDVTPDGSNGEFWLQAHLIPRLIKEGAKVYSNGSRFLSGATCGVIEASCVVTDSHMFEVRGVVNHNSVTLNNVIQHFISHPETGALAIIDVKILDTQVFKGVKNILAVANSIPEAREVLAIARQVMLKRNKQLAESGGGDFDHYKPKKPTDTYSVAGRQFTASDTVEIIRPGATEPESITVAELHQLIKGI